MAAPERIKTRLRCQCDFKDSCPNNVNIADHGKEHPSFVVGTRHNSRYYQTLAMVKLGHSERSVLVEAILIENLRINQLLYGIVGLDFFEILQLQLERL